jgi:hypothetical protein
VRVSKHPVTEWGGVTDTERELARELGLDLAAQSAEMADWAMGKGELKADWNAALRGWMRRTAERRAQSGGHGRALAPANRPPPKSRVEAYYDMRMAEIRAEEAAEAGNSILTDGEQR